MMGNNSIAFDDNTIIMRNNTAKTMKKSYYTAIGGKFVQQEVTSCVSDEDYGSYNTVDLKNNIIKQRSN